MQLAEAILTKHYNDRKAERGTITNVEVQKAAYGEYDVEETNQKLVPFLQTKLNQKLAEVEEKSFGVSKNNNLGVCVFMPILINGDKKYKITMNTESGDKGNYYLAIVMDDALITIYPTSAAGTAEVESAIDDHTKRENPNNTKSSKAIFPQSAIVEINIDELYGKEIEKAGEEKTSEETLDYKVRTDYRVGATFDHKQFGPGKVVAAAGGGKAGVNGMVDWIDVKYAKPFMKGGKLQDVRRFNNILTAAYFGKTMKEGSEEIKCKQCGWHWRLSDGGKDPYICHKCGYDNSPTQKELHTMKDDGYDEHQQVRADIEEMSLENPSAQDFLQALKANPEYIRDLIADFNFDPKKGLQGVEDYIASIDHDDPDWQEFQDWLEAKQKGSIKEASKGLWANIRAKQARGEKPAKKGSEAYNKAVKAAEKINAVDETDNYCPTCLAEYLTEYKDKIEEAEYRGRKVSLGKPFLTPGGPKKRSVYVKNAKGNVVKVNFGDPNMRIKKSIPARRKSYRARHHCQSPGPRWKANYWSCRAW